MCRVVQSLLFTFLFLLSPFATVSLLLQDPYQPLLFISAGTTVIGTGTIALWYCSNLYLYKFFAFVLFITSMSLCAFQLGHEVPQPLSTGPPTTRIILMLANILGIIFYAGLAFLVERQQNTLRQRWRKEVSVVRVNTL
jgi:hypothetical protein